MANLNQFYQGEAIKITVTADGGSALVGEYDAGGSRGEYDGTTFMYAGMRAYPNNWSPNGGESGKIKNFSTPGGEGAGKVFVIPGDVSRTMEEGAYAVELVYGVGDGDRVIVKTNNAFVLVGSAFKVEG